jgi:hypothetical protein
MDIEMLAERWEKQVTSYLDGDRALLARIAAVLPVGIFYRMAKKLTELDIVE